MTAATRHRLSVSSSVLLLMLGCGADDGTSNVSGGSVSIDVPPQPGNTPAEPAPPFPPVPALSGPVPGVRLATNGCTEPYRAMEGLCVHEVVARELAAELDDVLASYRRGAVPPVVEDGRIATPPAFADAPPARLPPPPARRPPPPAPRAPRGGDVFSPDWVASVAAGNQAARTQREERIAATERARQDQLRREREAEAHRQAVEAEMWRIQRENTERAQRNQRYYGYK